MISIETDYRTIDIDMNLEDALALESGLCGALADFDPMKHTGIRIRHTVCESGGIDVTVGFLKDAQEG